MKKIFIYIFTVFMFMSSSIAEESLVEKTLKDLAKDLNKGHETEAVNLMSWGLAGGYCSELNKFFDEFGSEIEGYLESAIQGFLTGANTSLILMNKENEVRNIGKHSSQFIMTHIIQECAEAKAEGEDVQVWPILGLYFDGLPYFKQ